MKNYRAKKGPFGVRPYYTSADIENTCSGELEKVGLLPTEPAPVRIERFIEKRFGIVPEYCQLDEGILGFTKFGPSGVEGIYVSSQLEAIGTRISLRRIQSTLAHEAGHGLFHCQLFSQPEPGLFDGVHPGPRILCRDEHLGFESTYDGKWWEYQANRAIGALLLPRGLVQKVAEPLLEPEGQLGNRVLPESWRPNLERDLSEIFDVNPVVARIRLSEVFPRKSKAQMAL